MGADIERRRRPSRSVVPTRGVGALHIWTYGVSFPAESLYSTREAKMDFEMSPSWIFTKHGGFTPAQEAQYATLSGGLIQRAAGEEQRVAADGTSFPELCSVNPRCTHDGRKARSLDT